MAKERPHEDFGEKSVVQRKIYGALAAFIPLIWRI